MGKSRGDNDIFDRSFKLIIGSLSPKALVGFINSLFGSRHPLESKVRHLSTEQIDGGLKKRQPDVLLTIEEQIYGIEAQITDDANMAIRVFEYGYAESLRNKEMKEGMIVLSYPRMIVIYLASTEWTPDKLVVRLKFPDGSEHDFKVETVKLHEYSVEALVERGFAPLLPFYITKVRKDAKAAKTEEERRSVEEGLKDLGVKLKEAIEGRVERVCFTDEDIATLLERLSQLVDYVGKGYRTTEVKEMLDNALKGYGQILVERGERRGKRHGERRAKLEAARSALEMGLSMEQAARITKIPVDTLERLLNSPALTQ